MPDKNKTLKERFLEAVIKGELGTPEKRGVVVTLKEFKAYFSDIKTQYISSFLPAATIEPGRVRATHTRFVFRVGKGVYLVPSNVLDAYKSTSG